MAPDFTRVLLFPVDCSRNFTSRMVCVARSVHNKSLDYKDNSFELDYVGYQTQKHKNNSILEISRQICPEGYNFGYRNVCLQLVRFPEFLSARTVSQCATWIYETFKILKCEEVLRYYYGHSQEIIDTFLHKYYESQQIIDMFNTSCRMADINSTVYGGIGDHYLRETAVLNNYFLQVLPSTALTFISWLATKATVNESAYSCPDRFLCPLFPHRKDVQSGHLKDVMSSRPFILCVRDPIRPPTIDIPDQFEAFTCTDRSLIAISLQCDGIPNCPNAEDEENCTNVCSSGNINCFTNCLFPACQCNDFYYQCIGGGCMTFDKFCNGQQDCPSGEDEEGCVVTEKPKYNVSNTIQNISLATGFCLDRRDSLPCASESECYNLQELCRYDTKDGIIIYCADGTHLGSQCKLHVCNHQYKCDLSYCIPTHKVCDGIVDCPDADDEAHCDNMACPGHLRCSHTTFCVPPYEVCDGEEQCPLEEDEKFCMLCPKGCFCRGSMISCNNIDHVHLSASPSVLVFNNSFSVSYHPEKTISHLLIDTFYLRINHGRIYESLQNDFSDSRLYQSLRWLQLNNQGIQILNRGFIHGPLLKWLDLSSNVIHSVKHQAFKEITNIEILNLDSNKLKYLKDHFFESLDSLKFLYLQGNPLVDIDSQILLNNPSVRLVRSDWYMLCCAVHHIEDCEPKEHLVSSCQSLLSFLTAKIFITIQGVFAKVVNVVVLVRLLADKNKSPDRPLMISLVSADIMMGIYLLMLTITDLSTSGAFHLYVAQWTQSYICLAAGILNFVSSEASLCVLAVLSVIRSAAIKRIGGLKALKNKIIHVTVWVWVFIFSLVVLYIIAFELGIVRLRNNMCIILGISHHHYVSVPEYAFQILLISLNSIFLFILCVGAFSIFIKVYFSSKSVRGMGSSHSHHGVSKIGARLMLLLLFNFVCWIPVLCVAGIMLTAGNVHENVLIWMAIFILPISATTDPFLYNIHLFKRAQTQK